MSQIRLLIAALKQEFCKQRINYRQVAKVLNLSEISVKRLFYDEAFSITRLERVCEMLYLDISDLIHRMEKSIALAPA